MLLRGARLVVESNLTSDLAAKLEERMTFYLPPNEHMLGRHLAMARAHRLLMGSLRRY